VSILECPLENLLSPNIPCSLLSDHNLEDEKLHEINFSFSKSRII
jgi:hypothetical protein